MLLNIYFGALEAHLILGPPHGLPKDPSTKRSKEQVGFVYVWRC